MSNGEERRRTAGGTAYIERGQGECVVLIHGVGLNAEAWEPQIAALAASHRVIAVDMAGHGHSAPPPAAAGLDDYVGQLRRLLDDLGIAAANVVGHSMGGLVAIGLALAHPERVLRLAVLNSVYERTAEARAAVEARAAEIAVSGGAVPVEATVSRWFGDRPSPLRSRVAAWLSAMEPASYAAAYRVFATGDRLFSGRLGDLACPALFATGALDPNSTPQMAEAMAAATPHGRASVLAGQRHMMNLTDPHSTTQALRNLLAQPLAR